MTVQEAIELACAMRKNELGETVLSHFVEELEADLAVTVRGEPVPVISTTQPLLVPSPFDRVYWTYLVSLIDLSVGPVMAYNLSKVLYEDARDAYARWYHRTGGKI